MTALSPSDYHTPRESAVNKRWAKENPLVSTQPANSVFTDEKIDGPMNISVNVPLELPGNHPLSKVPPTAKALSWRKSGLRQNSPTRP